MQTVAGSAPASRQAAARTALLHCREQPGHTFTADRVTQQQQARSRNNSFHAVLLALIHFWPILAQILKIHFKRFQKSLKLVQEEVRV